MKFLTFSGWKPGQFGFQGSDDHIYDVLQNQEISPAASLVVYAVPVVDVVAMRPLPLRYHDNGKLCAEATIVLLISGKSFIMALPFDRAREWWGLAREAV